MWGQFSKKGFSGGLFSYASCTTTYIVLVSHMKQPRKGLGAVSTYPILTESVGQNRLRIVLCVVMMFFNQYLGNQLFCTPGSQTFACHMTSPASAPWENL